MRCEYDTTYSVKLYNFVPLSLENVNIFVKKEKYDINKVFCNGGTYLHVMHNIFVIFENGYLTEDKKKINKYLHIK